MKKLIESFDVFVFDLDNTLVETNFNYVYELIINTIKTLGGLVPDQILAQAFWYAEKDREECIENHFHLSSSEFWKLFRKYDLPEERVKYTKVIKGVDEVLQSLKEQGKELAIITNTTPFIAIAEVRMLAMKFSKDNVLAVGEHVKYTPKPHRHSLDYLKEFVFDNQGNFVYIGDSYEDALFAQNAKTPFVHFNINDSALPVNLESLTSFNNWQQFSELLIK